MFDAKASAGRTVSLIKINTNLSLAQTALTIDHEIAAHINEGHSGFTQIEEHWFYGDVYEDGQYTKGVDPILFNPQISKNSNFSHFA